MTLRMMAKRVFIAGGTPAVRQGGCMPRNATLESILLTRAVGVSWRVLTVDLGWPTPYAEPPFAAGAVSVPAVSDPVPAYAAGSFDPAAWTDVSSLVTTWRYSQQFDLQCDVLSLTVPVSWAEYQLDQAFRSMRLVLLQQRFTGVPGDTGWVNVACCLSNGYQQRWDAEQATHAWTVNALDVLSLTGLDTLGSETGFAVYEADKVKHGATPSDQRVALALVDDSAADAWEFAITLNGKGKLSLTSISRSSNVVTVGVTGHGLRAGDGFTIAGVTPSTFNGTFTVATVVNANSLTFAQTGSNASGSGGTLLAAIQPNWCATPGPRFWAHDVPGESNPVPLAIAGDALNAVFGEGVLRLGKTYAYADPGDPPVYSEGLGYTAPAVPDVRGALHRYAHDATTDRGGAVLPSDLAESLTQIANPPVAGAVTVSGDYSHLPQALTLLARDGGGGRHLTVSHSVSGGQTTFVLSNSSVEVATGTALQYGDASRAVDVIRRWLLESGYQVGDSSGFLYAGVPETPQVRGTALPILLPPLSYRETDALTRQQAIADLHSQNAVLPSWQTRATADGQVQTTTLQQLADSATGPNADILPIWQATAAEVDRTDSEIYTRVIVHGRARQLTDWLQDGVTLADVNAAGGGLPTVNGSLQVTLNGTTYTLTGLALRSGATGQSYNFALDTLASPASEPSLKGKQNRPWAWYYRANKTSAGRAACRALRDAWQGALLMTLTFPAPVAITALELRAPNAWWSDQSDWGGDRHSDSIYMLDIQAHADNQILAVEYFDLNQQAWLPLASDLEFPVDLKTIVTLTEDDFDTRARVTTDRLRVRCIEPFFAESDTYDESWYNCVVGVYLKRFIAWSAEELRGVASLGDTEPFTGDAWETALHRLRRRTYQVPEVADWANTPALADALAIDWLYNLTRNLTSRPVQAFRPDARLGDTVRLLHPNGQVVCYGDDAGQLSGWRLFGVTMAHSDALVLYWSLTNSSSTRTVTLYANSARTQAVATGSRTGDGVITLAPANGSRISGTVTVAYTGNDTGTVGAPCYLVTGVERGDSAGTMPSLQQLTLTNYTDPYFEV